MFEEKKRKLGTVGDRISSIRCGDCNNSIGRMNLSDLSNLISHVSSEGSTHLFTVDQTRCCFSIILAGLIIGVESTIVKINTPSINDVLDTMITDDNFDTSPNNDSLADNFYTSPNNDNSLLLLTSSLMEEASVTTTNNNNNNNNKDDWKKLEYELLPVHNIACNNVNLHTIGMLVDPGTARELVVPTEKQKPTAPTIYTPPRKTHVGL
jgi:hypothetical protein